MPRLTESDYELLNGVAIRPLRVSIDLIALADKLSKGRVYLDHAERLVIENALRFTADNRAQADKWFENNRKSPEARSTS
jgi:hypothetical protein